MLKLIFADADALSPKHAFDQCLDEEEARKNASNDMSSSSRRYLENGISSGDEANAMEQDEGRQLLLLHFYY